MVNNVDAVLAAIADPTRRRMVDSLRDGALSVSELAEPHAMTLAAVVKHLGVLESAGVIRSSKTGRVRTCALVPGALSGVSDWLAATERAWNASLDALETHLEQNP